MKQQNNKKIAIYGLTVFFALISVAKSSQTIEQVISSAVTGQTNITVIKPNLSEDIAMKDWQVINLMNTDSLIEFEIKIKSFSDIQDAEKGFLRQMSTVQQQGPRYPFPMGDEVIGFSNAILVRRGLTVFWVVAHGRDKLKWGSGSPKEKVFNKLATKIDEYAATLK